MKETRQLRASSNRAVAFKSGPGHPGPLLLFKGGIVGSGKLPVVISRLSRAAVVFALASLAPACGDDDHGFIRSLSGDPYLGDVKVEIQPPAGANRGADSGTGSAQFILMEAGKARLVLVGNIKGQGDAGFAAVGDYDRSGWSSKTGEVVLRIASDGTISGGGKAYPNQFRFDGLVSEQDIKLTVDLEILKKTQSGLLPAGTKYVFTYDLNRDRDVPMTASRVSRESSGGQGKARPSVRSGNCKRVKYYLKNIPDGRGALALVRVPRCIPE